MKFHFISDSAVITSGYADMAKPKVHIFATFNCELAGKKKFLSNNRFHTVKMYLKRKIYIIYSRRKLYWFYYFITTCKILLLRHSPPSCTVITLPKLTSIHTQLRHRRRVEEGKTCVTILNGITRFKNKLLRRIIQHIKHPYNRLLHALGNIISRLITTT
jgi:hypothetical protein